MTETVVCETGLDFEALCARAERGECRLAIVEVGRWVDWGEAKGRKKRKHVGTGYTVTVVWPEKELI